MAAGSLDVSINVISRGDVQGTPLLDMTADDLLAPALTGLRTNFLAARAAPGSGGQSIAFLSSDRAAGITATTLNVTSGLVPGP